MDNLAFRIAIAILSLSLALMIIIILTVAVPDWGLSTIAAVILISLIASAALYIKGRR